MRKIDEVQNPNSCLNKAADDEPIFVLKSTDELAPCIVREWAQRYCQQKGGMPSGAAAGSGMTPSQYAKYREALQLADKMEIWRWSRTPKETSAKP